MVPPNSLNLVRTAGDAFVGKAQSFDEPQGRLVFQQNVRFYPVDVKVFLNLREKGAQRLGGVALAGMALVQLVAYATALVIGAGNARKAHRTDDACRVLF